MDLSDLGLDFHELLLLTREYPTSFRSLLDDYDGKVHGCSKELATTSTLSLKVRCHCSKCAFCVTLHVSGSTWPASVRCYCKPCRRYHSSAFAAFVLAERVSLGQVGSMATSYRDMCEACGPVDRLFCGKCHSTIATLPIEAAQVGLALVALGCVEDSSVPAALAYHWQGEFREWAPSRRAHWWTVVPKLFCAKQLTSSQQRLCGGCACGGCAFEALFGSGFQMQHCYCNLCRRLSGTVGQTWVPVAEEGFRWMRHETLELVRTTPHGKRHICTRCGVVMTIVYDSQLDTIWPVAGTIDDTSFPEDLESYLCRVVHICCSMMQPWYRLPDDGLPRLRYAG